MNVKKEVSAYLICFVLTSIFFAGCITENSSNNSDNFILSNIEVNTRCGYDNTIYRDSVLDVSVTVTNKDVNPGNYEVNFYIDDYWGDKETVFLNASEGKTITLTNLDKSTNEFSFEGLHLNTTGNHTITVGNISRNITVSPPVLDITIQNFEWKQQNQGYIPSFNLRVRNPTDKHFFLGRSFGIVTDDNILEASVEEWDLIFGYVNTTGFYKIPEDGIADVTIICYDIVADFPDGSDTELEFIRIFAGFPWLDFTAGIIGEIKI